MSRASMIIAAVLAPLVASLLAGCPMGPETIRVNRTVYNDAMQATNNEQLLLNIVRLRYHGATCFMEINSIQSQFRFDLNGSLQFQNPRYTNRKSFGMSNSGGWIGNLAGDYSENPTISYSPLQGELFARRVLQPMDFPTLELLLNNGWKMGDLLGASVECVGELQNRPQSETYPKFLKLCELLQTIHKRDALTVFIRASKEDKEEPVMEHIALTNLKPELAAFAEKNGHKIVLNKEDGTFSIVKPPPQNETLAIVAKCESGTELAELRDLLSAAGSANGGPGPKDQGGLKFTFSLTKNPNPTTQPAASPEIFLPLHIRSLNNVLLYLGQGVQVPPGHAQFAKPYFAFPSAEVEEAWLGRARAMLDVKCSAVLPPTAAVAVFHRGWWFYIAEDDCKSKDTFAMLGHIYAIQAGEIRPNAPVLALPVGGG